MHSLKLEYHVTDQITNHTCISVNCRSVHCACPLQVVRPRQIENLIMLAVGIPLFVL